MASLIETFKRIPGNSRNPYFLNIITGERVTRRQKEKALKAGQNYEALARASKASNELEQLARPAPGRSSARKLAPPIKADVAKARKEEKERIAKEAKAASAKKLVERKIERAKVKKVKTPKISKRLLKPGKISRTVDFDDPYKLDEILEQVRATPEIFAYYLGFDAVHEQSGNRVDITLYARESASNEISGDEFAEAVEDYLDGHRYLVVSTYWIRLVFYEKFASKLAKDKGVKWQQRS